MSACVLEAFLFSCAAILEGIHNGTLLKHDVGLESLGDLL